MDSIRLCSVEGCDRKHEARGLCHTHYARAIRERVIDASPRADLSERDSLMKSLYESGLSTTQVGERVGLDDSGVSRRLRNMGVEMRPRVRQRNDSSLTYSGAHMRVRSDRGRAQDRLCSCGAQAAQWAYRHDDPAEMHSELGAYSADPSRYDAMCVPCHKRSDLERIARAS